MSWPTLKVDMHMHDMHGELLFALCIVIAQVDRSNVVDAWGLSIIRAPDCQVLRCVFWASSVYTVEEARTRFAACFSRSMWSTDCGHEDGNLVGIARRIVESEPLWHVGVLLVAK